MKLFQFEYERIKKIIVPIASMALVLQLLFLYFFALVGRFDNSDHDSLLTGYNAVLGLATTGTMCVLAIYGTVLASQLLVRDYIGMNKNKTFSLPVNRSQLFLTRVMSFSLIFAVAELFGLLIANLIFSFSGIWLPLTVEQPLGHPINLITTIFASICLTLGIVLISSFIGIQFNSTIKSIVTSITSWSFSC